MSSPATAPSNDSAIFRDGLGERRALTDPVTGETVEVLSLARDLTTVASFEFALRERTARLANFRHSSYVRVRRVDRLPSGGLAIVSDHVEGTRLSEILRLSEERGLTLDINAALFLVRQLVPAIALLHENARDVGHGALAPERLVVTPHARLLIVESVLGSALEQLQYTRDRFWQHLRVAVPESAGAGRFDHRTDVAQMGIVALSLILGRRMRDAEYPRGVQELLLGASEVSVLGYRQPLSPELRGWLGRALQLDPRHPYLTAKDALAGLDQVLTEGSVYVAAPVALETFLSRYFATTTPAPVTAADIPAPATVPAAAMRAAEPLPPIERIEDLLALDATPAGPMLDDADEAPQEEPAPSRHRSWLKWRRLAAVIVAILCVGEGAVLGTRLMRSPSSAPQTGTVLVQTSPAGVEIFVDGVARGLTPATLPLKAGAHILELRGRGVPRVIPMTITAGASISQYIELAEAPAVGRLQVSSDPPGAKVTIDGKPSGTTPVFISEIAPGEHAVVLESAGGTVRQGVIVQAGTTASVVVPLAAAAAAGPAASGPVSGWMALAAPFVIELYENGKLLGSSDTEKIMLPAGRHEIELVNDTLGYRATKVVQIPPGKTTPVRLELPRGTVSVNAVPWAEVWIDGQRIGETPIANVQVPIGPHEVIFKHPTLGERRHAISVGLTSPTRVSVDLSR